MTIEHAIVRTKPKPWGSLDLRPWSQASTSDGPIGELWFERPGLAAPKTALLLKLLLTTEPLSIQVHPDDAFARSIGLANGKTEAWYILSAIPGAKVAVGLNYPCSAAELRTAITDGSIVNIVHWHPVRRGDVIFIPAGTIHAIGAGIVLAEIQQHSDATFRLFDYGRERQLHIENAVAVATAGPREIRSPPERLSDARTALTVNSYFALEQIDLAPCSVWMLDAPKETWLLAIDGHAQLGSTSLAPGDAVFLEADHAEIEVGANGWKALLAYPGPNVNPGALTERNAANASRVPHASPCPLVPTSLDRRTQTIGDAKLAAVKRIAFIGNSLPRRCGIATFTTDLQSAIAASRGDLETVIVAMTDHGQIYDYPSTVDLEINDDRQDDYIRAADYLNGGGFEAVSLQHEFGIFGGESGGQIMALLSRLTIPIVTTLHTVLSEPTQVQRDIIARIVEASSKVVVMAEKGRELLRSTYHVADEKIEVIPHGIPEFAFVEPDAAKAELGFSNKSVILTFGLLSPNKGIEVMIEAMPLILKTRPDAVYVVLGATHPNLLRDRGEAYRETLVAHARRVGVEHHVVFLDQFVDQKTLLDFISMSDVYVTPYLNEAQMTSGTLAYSFGLGKAVVSTPYWHARELLADGRGILVPFGDAAALGIEIAKLLTNDVLRQAMRKRAYSSSRAMTWERTAERYMSVFENAGRRHRLKTIARSDTSTLLRDSDAPPEMQLGHFLSMCDDTGLFQHAVHSVPDRAHGYCVDDNARALLVACALNNPGEQRLPEALTARFAAFVQHSWNPDLQRFRNFMGFNRCWLEDKGSEDSHGRALWALGACALTDANLSRRSWAAALFSEAMPTVENFRSPRAWAFALLGLDAYCSAVPSDFRATRLRAVLADQLILIFDTVATDDWVWFEDGLAYDNARLPQALIMTGIAGKTSRYVDIGLESLRWLVDRQTSAKGQFRPIGTAGFGDRRQPPQAFDQQPLEAAATIAACLAAWRADHDVEWKAEAARVFAWFLGSNDLSVSLVDLETGSCRDGLHPDRPNENRGAESVVSYLLGLSEIRQIARLSESRAKPAPLVA